MGAVAAAVVAATAGEAVAAVVAVAEDEAVAAEVADSFPGQLPLSR